MSTIIDFIVQIWGFIKSMFAGLVWLVTQVPQLFNQVLQLASGFPPQILIFITVSVYVSVLIWAVNLLF